MSFQAGNNMMLCTQTHGNHGCHASKHEIAWKCAYTMYGIECLGWNCLNFLHVIVAYQANFPRLYKILKDKSMH